MNDVAETPFPGGPHTLPPFPAGLDPRPLLAAAAFSPRHLRSPHAWIALTPVAYWLIAELRPRLFVELGCHSGNSYFSFCQAIDDFQLTCSAYAVDTWRGDEHAGFYDDAVYREVEEANSTYARFSYLLRTTFEDAAGHFADGTIDLLHIDGLHTYEAVRNDYGTWRTKVSPGGVILFHDVAVRETNFGVWRFWEELTATHPYHITFTHSWGLGILYCPRDADDRPPSWLIPGSSEQRFIQVYFAALGEHALDRYFYRVYKKAAEDKERMLQDYALREQERELELVRLQETLKERDEAIHRLTTSRSWRLTAPLRVLGRLILARRPADR